MNLSMKKRNRLKTQRFCGCQEKGIGKGWMWSLGLTGANYYIENG